MKLCVKLRCTALALPLLLGTAAQAATVVWPAVDFEYIDATTCAIGSDISLGGAGVWLEVVSDPGPKFSLQANDITIGIGHRWFATQYGAALDASALVSADYLANADTMEFGSVDMPFNQVFYLGFCLDGPPIPTFPYSPSYYLYGWAALLWDGTDLTLVDSAAETTGVGIYAGTYDAIPEPAVAGLLLVGLVVLAMRRRHTWRPSG